MGAITQLMTSSEFEELPEEIRRNAELRHGELAPVAEPDQIHAWIQHRLMRLLERRADAFGIGGMETSFRPHGDNEYNRVDVAFVSSSRRRPVRKGYLHGFPELVIEALSPSNTASEMNDRRQLFFETGCLEFWEVDSSLLQINVSTQGWHHYDIPPGPLHTAAPLWRGCASGRRNLRRADLTL
jgi:Uma2 family endonuclease